MIGIVLNADDFGISRGVCDAIRILLEEHSISSTSVMCAAPGALDLCNKFEISRWKGSVGVHLMLTSGECLADPASVRSLLVPGTRSLRDPRNTWFGEPEEVEIEWRAQIKAATELIGGTPSHLDSHHGMHRIPIYFDIYARLAKELSIPVRGLLGKDAEQMRRDRIPGSLAIVRDWTGKGLSSEALKTQIRRTISNCPKETVVEVVCHPGYSDDYLQSVSSLNRLRENDLVQLRKLKNEGWPMSHGYLLLSRQQEFDRLSNDAIR